MGFLLLWWQLSVQHGNTLKANAEKDRNALNLEIYRDLAATSEEATRQVFAIQKLWIQADGFWALWTGMGGMSVGVPSYEDFRNAGDSCSAAVIALLARLEKWEIALGPGRVTFHRAFGDNLTALNAAISSLLSAMATTSSTPPVLRAAGSAIFPATADLMASVWDLRAETQNVLLGGLFSHRIPRRQPTDPSMKVATLDQQQPRSSS